MAQQYIYNSPNLFCGYIGRIERMVPGTIRSTWEIVRPSDCPEIVIRAIAESTPDSVYVDVSGERYRFIPCSY